MTALEQVIYVYLTIGLCVACITCAMAFKDETHIDSFSVLFAAPITIALVTFLWLPLGFLLFFGRFIWLPLFTVTFTRDDDEDE